MRRVAVPAKINLALVVGERRDDGLHELSSVVQRIDLCDRMAIEEGSGLLVEGFRADTLVSAALVRLAEAAGVEPRWRVRLDKRIPLGAGLGGGSADAGAALRLANATLPEPLPRERLLEVAAATGSDVPFFLEPGPKLVEGAGAELTPLELPQDFWILLVLPWEALKSSTGDVYARFDESEGADGFAERRALVREAVASCRRPRDLAALPPNDLAEAAGRPPLVDELLAAGAFRADVSGAGPALYGLFHQRAAARAAARGIAPRARVWLTAPVW